MSLLEVDRLASFYGDFQALFDVSVQVAEGETVAVIGANGAGKSTLLRTVAGLLRPRRRQRRLRRAAPGRGPAPTAGSAWGSPWSPRAGASSRVSPSRRT